MREYVAKIGGRYTYVDDFIGLQDLAASMVTIFDGCRNFILSGCETSGTNTSFNISSGLVYINGHIREFAGANGIDLTSPYYIYETMDDKHNVPYAQNASQQGYIIYGAEGSSILPPGKQYIEITSSYIPRLKDEFFGKYALTLDSSFPQQTVNKNLVLKQDLYVKGKIFADSSLLFRNELNQTELSVGMDTGGNTLMQFKKNSKNTNCLSFGNDGILRVIINDDEKLAVAPGNVAIKGGLMIEELRSDQLSISTNGISNYFNDSPEASVDINKVGFNGGTTKPRHLNIYDGMGNMMFRFDATKNMNLSYLPIKEESTNPHGYILKDTAHAYLDNSYNKSIAWEDMNGVVMATVGFTNSSDNSLVITHSHNGNIVLKASRVDIKGEFANNGELLTDKFATRTYVTEELAKKVDTKAGMGLSEQNFTSELKAKLDRINPDNYASGGDVTAAIGTALLKANNLKDVASVVDARTNLDVYSKQDCDKAYLRIDKKLTDLPALTEEDKLAIRTKIDAAPSALQAEIDKFKTLVDDKIKEYCDNKFAEKLAITTKTEGGLTFTQIGPVVSIGGTITPKSQGEVLFNIPGDIGAPSTDISGTIDAGYGNNEDINMGVVWKCTAGTRAVRAEFEYKSSNKNNSLPFHCTYVTQEKKPPTGNQFF